MVLLLRTLLTSVTGHWAVKQVGDGPRFPVALGNSHQCVSQAVTYHHIEVVVREVNEKGQMEHRISYVLITI